MTFVKTFALGKVPYTSNKGRKINEVEVTVTYINDKLSIVGGIWNAKKTDYSTCGQYHEEIDRYSKYMNVKARNVWKAIKPIWEKWHLNDMHAGTIVQETYLKEYGIKGYENQCAALEDANIYAVYLEGEELTLNPHVSQPYKYGHGWLKRKVPDSVIGVLYALCDKAVD
jgi:hypothetical protein